MPAERLGRGPLRAAVSAGATRSRRRARAAAAPCERGRGEGAGEPAAREDFTVTLPLTAPPSVVGS